MAAEDKFPDGTSFSKIGAWVGIAGSLVTITLTIWNVYTKGQIDAHERQLKDRSADVEASRERVERYKWVYTLFPDLKSQDVQDKTLSIALIRLALSPKEAKDLFASLAQSNDKNVQQAAQKGLKNLQNEPGNELILRMNGEQADDRKAALSELIHDYKGSPAAISGTLRLFDDVSLAQLSSPGVINALYYLTNTDPGVWSPDQVKLARNAIEKTKQRFPGSQAQAKIAELKTFLQRMDPLLNQ